MPYSFSNGKREVCAWVRGRFLPTCEVLDVGAGCGTWRQLLPEYRRMDAIEIFKPSFFRLEGYREKFLADIRRFEYERYDLIIFGDVIEHLSVEDAQRVLSYAEPRCTDMIVAVPFLYPQEPIGGNEAERHLQDDLTPEVFAARYPQLDVLHDTGCGYCYYHKGDGDK